MNRAETAGILAIALEAYQHAAPNPDALLSAWHMALDDVPADVAALALRRHVRENKWFPKPAEMRSQCVAMTHAIPEPGDAWAMVQQHMRDHGYLNPPPFVGPDCVAEAVRAMGGWHQLRRSEQPERDREQFMRLYQTYQTRAARDLHIADALEHVAALPETA